MSEERFITISEDDDGQRLDRWLKKNAPDIPYALVQKLIRKGAFRINSKRAKGDKRLVQGDEIRIPAIENAKARPKTEKPLTEQEHAQIKAMIIYEDKDIIALNKTAGLATQGGSKQTQHVDRLIAALANKEGVKPRLVHRLDKDTSGILLLARSAKIAKALGDTMKRQRIKKIYWALVAPPPEMQRGAIKAPLIKAGGLNKERMVVDDENGKFALTDYEVIEQALDKACFIAFWPRTGRTHQIRVHTELIGSPIIGDPKYRGQTSLEVENDPSRTDSRIDVRDGSLNLAKRLHLHAHSLTLKHPSTGKIITLTAPLPDDLKKSWKSLGFNPAFKGDIFDDIEMEF